MTLDRSLTNSHAQQPNQSVGSYFVYIERQIGSLMQAQSYAAEFNGLIAGIDKKDSNYRAWSQYWYLRNLLADITRFSYSTNPPQRKVDPTQYKGHTVHMQQHYTLLHYVAMHYFAYESPQLVSEKRLMHYRCKAEGLKLDIVEQITYVNLEQHTQTWMLPGDVGRNAINHLGLLPIVTPVQRSAKFSWLWRHTKSP